MSDVAQLDRTAPKTRRCQDILTTHAMFREQFEVLEARSPAELRQATALRYQVYCQEKGFEDPARFPDGLETDVYDQRSAHVLIRHRATGIAIATTRLVLADKEDTAAAFPLERHYNISLDTDNWQHLLLPRHSLGEVSRFAISKTARELLDRRFAQDQRVATGQRNGGDTTWTHLVHIHLTIALIASAISLSAQYDVTHWYTLMAPSLIRHLARFGLHFNALGPAISFHGQRVGSLESVDQLLEGVLAKRPDIWQLLTSAENTRRTAQALSC